MIFGVNHLTLSVKNLEESFLFYKSALGFRPLMKGPKSAYFLAGSSWFCIEEEKCTREGPLPEYTHIAFSIEEDKFLSAVDSLKKWGVSQFKDNSSEGASFYFLDPNGHKLELHVGDWKSRLETYRQRTDLKDVEFFDL